MKLTFKTTERGFSYIEFNDCYTQECSIQKKLTCYGGTNLSYQTTKGTDMMTGNQNIPIPPEANTPEVNAHLHECSEDELCFVCGGLGQVRVQNSGLFMNTYHWEPCETCGGYGYYNGWNPYSAGMSQRS